jgi:glycine hydroxymethyltransferase
MRPTDMPHLASLIADGLDPQCDHAALATRVTQWRAQFSGVHFTLDAPPVSAWEGYSDVSVVVTR